MLNPVLRREMKASFRSWKMFAAITLYIFLLAAATILYVRSVSSFNMYNYGFNPSHILSLYILLWVIQLFYVLITTPALTAGSISGERERQTLDLLLITKMSPLSIIIGKLLSCIGVVLLNTLISMPIFAAAFYYGGISIMTIFAMTIFMMIVSCMIGAISIFLSTAIKKTVISMVLMYLLIGFLCGGTVIIYAISMFFYYAATSITLPIIVKFAILSLNPAIGFVSLIDRFFGFNSINDIINMFYYSGNTQNFTIDFWIVNCFAMILVTVFFVFASANLLSKKRDS